ncbi:unnamed protein product [Mytilus coruscus]|uniref:Uncharacterized protein n=1 Tax=Mytilus coruscus TaxID=42192 RepID=A0A6J8AD90_MYTCO|nr:unnamed protein product [Mytilus coruscus]
MPVSQKSTLNSPVNTGQENQDKLEHRQIPERNGHDNNMNVTSFDAFSGSDNARDFVSVEPNNRPGTEFTNVGAQSKEMGKFSSRPSNIWYGDALGVRQNEEFALNIKRTRPRTLQEAVLSAVQEECLRLGEQDLFRDAKPANRFDLWDRRQNG